MIGNLLKFSIQSEDKHSLARVGKIETDHSIIETPVFMPVGTHGVVKSLSPNELYDCLLYTSPSPRDQRGSRMPSSA